MAILHQNDLVALWLTLKLATLSTCILLLLGTPIAYWLAHTKCRAKVVIEALVALPIVLPPTVLGFYLLVALGPKGPIGQLMIYLGGHPLTFSFYGLVVGSVIYSFPFAVQPIQHALTNIGKRPLEVAATLGASPLDRFFTVTLPLARPGFLTAAVLGFAHTIGEFGVVLMIGGNIPGRTQVLSIAIYNHVEALQYPQAYWLSGILLLLCFIMLIAVYSINHKFSMLAVS